MTPTDDRPTFDRIKPGDVVRASVVSFTITDKQKGLVKTDPPRDTFNGHAWWDRGQWDHWVCSFRARFVSQNKEND